MLHLALNMWALLFLGGVGLVICAGIGCIADSVQNRELNPLTRNDWWVCTRIGMPCFIAYVVWWLAK